MLKNGSSDLLEIRVYPFTQSFEINLFTTHVLRRTAHLFAEKESIGERCFVAVTAVDPETLKGPSSLLIVVPKWGLAPRDDIYVDVRELLAMARGIAVSSVTETEHGVTVCVEWNGQRSAFAAMKIHESAGRIVLATWERVGAGVALPLLPTTPGNLQ